MLNRTLQACLLLLVIAATGLGLHLRRVRPEDFHSYQALVESSDPSRIKHPVKVESRQARTGNHKDLWLSGPSGRTHCRMESPTAELVFSEFGALTQIREMVRNATCFMQEELYYLAPDGQEVIYDSTGNLIYKGARRKAVTPAAIASLKPMQRLRQFWAESGTFFYGSNLFEAENLRLCRFSTPSHELIPIHPDTHLLFEGEAKTAEVTFGSHHPSFRAQGLKAKLHHQEATL